MFLRFFFYLSLPFLLCQCTKLHNKTQKFDNIKVALVLGGGGSKCFAQVGVIEVLEENNIPISLIVGTSAGSAVGALYADNKDIKKTKEILFKATNKELLDFSFKDTIKMFTSLSSPISGKLYEKFIRANLHAKDFKDLKLPLVVVATDINKGQKYVIHEGNIAHAVRASSAIPAIIAPVTLNKHLLVDGGILEPVPVATARSFNPEMIIAVDINNLPPENEASNMLELAYKALWLSYYQLSRLQSSSADIDIHPDLKGHGTFEDNHKQELYQLGRNAALFALPQIKKKLRELEKRS